MGTFHAGGEAGAGVLTWKSPRSVQKTADAHRGRVTSAVAEVEGGEVSKGGRGCSEPAQNSHLSSPSGVMGDPRTAVSRRWILSTCDFYDLTRRWESGSQAIAYFSFFKSYIYFWLCWVFIAAEQAFL